MKNNEFNEKFTRLKELEKVYFDITWQNELIYPYLRTKIFGILSNNEAALSRGTKPLTQFSKKIVDKGQQISSLVYDTVQKEVDVLLVPFYRFEKVDNRVIDIKTEEMYQNMISQGLSVTRLVYRNQSQYVLGGENVYFMDDIHQIVNQRAVPLDTPMDSELVRLYEFQKTVQEQLQINFVIDDYLVEFGNRAVGYRTYFRKVLSAIKPKVIVMPATYLFSDLLIVAKEMGIPVFDVQYAAFTNGHVGYNYKYQNNFFPDYILGWSEMWNRTEIFGPQTTKFIVQGLTTKNTNKEKITSRKVVFVSQNLLTEYFFQEAAKFATAYPDYSVFIKLHPNDNYKEHLVTLVNSIANLSVVEKTDVFDDAEFVVGSGSSLLFELMSSNRKVIILGQSYMSAFMYGFDEGHNVYFADNLIQEFPNIKEKKLNKIKHAFSDMHQPLDYKKLFLVSQDSQIQDEVNHKHEFDFYDIEEILKEQGVASRELHLLSSSQSYLLSIVVTLYNDADNIDWLIQTIVNSKSYRQNVIEIVLVDVGSSDDTRNKADLIASHYEHVKIVAGNPDTPTTSLQSRKRGVVNATGKYVFFLDGDDFIQTHNVDIILEEITQKQPDLVKLSLDVYFERNQAIATWLLPYKVIKSRDEFLHSEQVLSLRFMHTHVYLREKIQLTTFDLADIRVGEDHFFNDLHYLNVERVLTLPIAMNVWHKQEYGTESTKPYRINDYQNSLTTLLTVLKAYKIDGLIPRDYLNKYIELMFLGNLQTKVLRNSVFEELITPETITLLKKINRFINESFSSNIPLFRIDVKKMKRRSERVEITADDFLFWDNRLYLKNISDYFDILKSGIEFKQGAYFVDTDKMTTSQVKLFSKNVEFVQNFKKTFKNIVIKTEHDGILIEKQGSIAKQLLTFTKNKLFKTTLTQDLVPNQTEILEYQFPTPIQLSNMKLAKVHSAINEYKLSNIGSDYYVVQPNMSPVEISIQEEATQFVAKIQFKGKLQINSLVYVNGAELNFKKYLKNPIYSIEISSLNRHSITIGSVNTETDNVSIKIDKNRIKIQEK